MLSVRTGRLSSVIYGLLDRCQRRAVLAFCRWLARGNDPRRRF